MNCYSLQLLCPLAACLLAVLVSAQKEDPDLCTVRIGPLKRTKHSVSGDVCAYDLQTIIIENFTFDGLGAGVFINIATEGATRHEWLSTRKIVPYPSPLDPRPIERAYNGETLVITLPDGIDVTQVKWFSIWCEIFGISFGEIKFQ